MKVFIDRFSDFLSTDELKDKGKAVKIKSRLCCVYFDQ